MRNRTWIMVAFGAAMFLPTSTAEAKFFGRRQARTAASCPGGVCRMPGGPGLVVNNKGGFEGQLTDAQYGIGEKSILVAATPTLAKSKVCSIEDALIQLKTLQQQQKDAQNVLAQAIRQQQGLLAVQSAQLQADITMQQLQLDQQNTKETARIAALKATHQDLQIKVQSFKAQPPLVDLAPVSP